MTHVHIASCLWLPSVTSFVADMSKRIGDDFAKDQTVRAPEQSRYEQCLCSRSRSHCSVPWEAARNEIKLMRLLGKARKMHTKSQPPVVQTAEESTRSGMQYIRRFPDPINRFQPKIEESA